MNRNYIFAISALTSVCVSADVKAENLYPSRVDLTGKLGNERTLGELDLMSPIKQDPNKIIYIDFRGQIDNDQAQEFNLGLGVRKIINTKLLGEAIIGNYGFLDVRKSENNNMFYQTTLGAELLSEKFDLRSNIYIPINQEEKINTTDVNLSNSQSGVRVSYSDSEKAMYGIDVETGTGFKLDEKASLRFYAGAYHFENSDVENVTGPRFRTEFLVDNAFMNQENSKFTLGYEWQHDKPRGSQGFLSARLSIPFGANKDSKLEGMQKRMLSPVVRDIDIVTSNKVQTENALFEDGTAIENFYNGVDTAQELHDSTTMGDKNSLVVISDDLNTPYSSVISEGQKVVGGQSFVKLKTPTGKTVFYKTQGKQDPVVENTNGNTVFTTAESTDASKIEVFGLQTKAGSNNTSIVLPTFTKIEFDSSVSADELLGKVKLVNLKNEDLTYTIVVANPDFDDQQPVGPGNEEYLTDVLTIDSATGEIKAGSNIAGANDMIEAMVTVTDSSGEDHETFLQLANENITNADYTTVLPGTYYTNGVTINFGTDLNNTDANAGGKTKIEYVADLINKLLEKDKAGDGAIIKALEKNQPHLVNFNNLADLGSTAGNAYFYAIPNSQDLQADEIFPNANANNGADTVSSNRDASVEEIVHMIHNYGITYARPDLQVKLDQLTQAALDAGKLDWAEGHELPRGDLDDEYLADCVEAFYNLKAGAGYVKTGVGLDPGSNRDDLKAFDPEMHDLIAEIFPDSLDLGY